VNSSRGPCPRRLWRLLRQQMKCEIVPIPIDMLGAQPGDVWIVRPDGHIAAVVPVAARAILAGAIRRVLALPGPGKAF
jgi:hypothetical protein